MFYNAEYPILEYDDNINAKINPSDFAGSKFHTDKLIITFFPDIMEKLKYDRKIIHEKTINGENPVVLYRFADDPDILITLGMLGCPACAGNLDMLNGMGISKVMFCGGGGVLDSSLEVGQLLLVDGAIRDEGFSYHYFAPSKYIYTNKLLTDKIAAFLNGRGIPYIRGLTWTTDAIFRETDDRIMNRRNEGAWIVEMEQSGCIAVANYRGFQYGALIYGGDDCASEKWSNRDWFSRDGVRSSLVQLCKELLRIF